MDRVRQLENRVQMLERMVESLLKTRGGGATTSRIVLAMGEVDGMTGTTIVDPSTTLPADPLTVGEGNVKLLTINKDGQIEYMLDHNGAHVTRKAISTVTNATSGGSMLTLARSSNKDLHVIVEDCGG